MRRVELTVPLLLLLGACAGAGGMVRPAGSNYILVEEQLRQEGYATLYEVIQAQRPLWLRTRGVDSFRTPSQIQVYVDNIRVGGISNLEQISPLTPSYVQWYNGIEASARWGLGHGAGAIYVSTAPMRE